MRNALVTFIYPGAEKFLPDFMPFATMASYSDMDVIAFSDGCLQIPEWAYTVHVDGSIVDNRIFALQWLKQRGYSSIIFLDIDDAMGPMRIPTHLSLLSNYPVVCNDVIPFVSALPRTGSSGIWAERFPELPFVFDSNFIDTFNIVGFGNTGIRIDQLPVEQLKTTVLPVMADWFLYKQLLTYANISAIFTADCSTWYRQHDNNIAGIKLRSTEYLNYIGQVKALHAEACRAIGISVYSDAETSNYKLHKPKSYENYFWWEN